MPDQAHVELLSAVRQEEIALAKKCTLDLLDVVDSSTKGEEECRTKASLARHRTVLVPPSEDRSPEPLLETSKSLFALQYSSMKEKLTRSLRAPLCC